ncbi:MAG: DUF5615 family PIN-like protein [Acidobacteria bacterium]|nr:DUF5615 family PIN-like protein [Acidobacteriota bacterium]
MRVLLDESLPRQLKRELAGFEVQTVPEVGWAGKKNGELLGLADARFDVFVTMDRRLPAQQNLGNLGLTIVILLARSNSIEDLLPLVADLKRALERPLPGGVVRIGSWP